MPRSLIVGAFGQDNTGDEALLAASLVAVRAAPGWDAVVATNRPDETAEQLDVECVPAGAAMAARAAARADALVVGGGTLFKELHPASRRHPGSLLRRTMAMTSIFRARRRPVVLLGVGAAPIRHPSNQALARSLAHRSDLLVLRDATSADLLTAMGVRAPLRVGADLAWLALPTSAFDRGPAEEPVLGVAVSHLAGDRGMARRLGAALRRHADAGVLVELEPWQGSPRLGADALLAADLASLIGPAARVVDPPSDMATAVERTRSRRATLALRFHAAVAAVHAGRPFAAVAHEPKLEDLAGRARQPVIAVDATVDEMDVAIGRALGGSPAPAGFAATERRRAAAMADLLGLVLTGEGEGRNLAELDLVPDPASA